MSLAPVFSYVADGPIFRLLIDAASAQLAVEVRNPARRETSFTVIDLSGPRLVFDGLGLPEPWFCGMSALVGGRLYLHTYPDQRYPDPKGIIAVAVAQQAIVWETPDWYLDRAGLHQLHVYRMGAEGREEMVLAAASGQPALAEAHEPSDEIAPSMQSPAQYLPDSEQFATVAKFVAQQFGLTPIHPIHYLEIHGQLILHLYHQVQAQLMGEWLVLDATTGAARLRVALPVKGLVGEPFMVHGHQLILIEGENTLQIYPL